MPAATNSADLVPHDVVRAGLSNVKRQATKQEVNFGQSLGI
jgi:hypothetical protein